MIDRQRGYLPSNTVREIIRDNAMLLPAISRFDISFGFGDSSIERACRDNNVDTATFIGVCNLLSGYGHNDGLQVSLPSLMGYLRRAHTSFLDITLPRIRHHLIEAINYSDTNEAALLLIKYYDDYVGEVRRHMDYENDVIFVYVEGLLGGHADADFSIEQFSVNHESMTEKLNEIKDIFIYHYKQKENARLSSALFDIITCERDMMAHFEVENRLFVPAVRHLEERVRATAAGSESDAAAENHVSESDAQPPLSRREKDIIREIARGKANKEIADELCISVNTVATHRRNIFAKLGIHSSAGLAIFAIINHLIDIDEVAQGL